MVRPVKSLLVVLAAGLCLAALLRSRKFMPMMDLTPAAGPLRARPAREAPPSRRQAVAGAGGTYLPITPNDLVPPDRTAAARSTSPPAPNPEGMSCPAVHVLHLGPGAPGPVGGILEFLVIHPHFTKNAAGGYDGSDRHSATT